LKEPGETLKWNGAGVNARIANAFAGTYPVPDTLKWDLFLGVDARLLSPDLSSFNWRGWVDWGTARSAIWARI